MRKELQHAALFLVLGKNKIAGFKEKRQPDQPPNKTNISKKRYPVNDQVGLQVDILRLALL